jgi:vacuolar protein sorting-associated protein 13A/C
MLEGLIEKIIAAKLGDYLSGLDKEHLQIAMWKGDITLNDVQIRQTAVSRFKLPLRLVLGKISRLAIKVPWSKLSS